MNVYAPYQQNAKHLDVTIIGIRPFRNGWQVNESAGVQPLFLDQEQAIDYAGGHERGVGHYLDFISAVLGLSLFPTGYLLHSLTTRRF